MGILIISVLLFADDIVLIGSTKRNLKKLMKITLRYFKSHRLTLSTKKSKILTHDAEEGQMVFEGDDDVDDLSLDQVIAFKYLGVTFNCAPYSLFKNFNEQVRRRAHTYAYRVLSLSKCGPKRSDLAFSLWNQVALPSILYGSEVIPLTKETINEVEKCQSIVGKFILQIPRSSANVTCNIDAGLRPIWSIVAERVLVYARSTMEKPRSYWPKIAMDESISETDISPYTRYLQEWKDKVDSYGMNRDQIKKGVKRVAMNYVISQLDKNKTTTFALSLPGSSTASPWFTLKPWVNDTGIRKIFAEFRTCNAQLGNRGPTKNGNRFKLCPLCSKSGLHALNNEVTSYADRD